MTAKERAEAVFSPNPPQEGESLWYVMNKVRKAISDAVAEEHEAILKLGDSFAYDCCEEFKEAIRARSANE